MSRLVASKCAHCGSSLPTIEEGETYRLRDQYDVVVVGAVSDTHVYFSKFHEGESSYWLRLKLVDFASQIQGVDEKRKVFGL